MQACLAGEPIGIDEAFRTVIIDREVPGVPSVVADTASAFASITRHFIESGHSRIAFVGGPAGSWQNDQRIAAIREAADGYAAVEIFGPVAPTFAAGSALTEAVLASGATALIPYSTAVGLGLLVGLGARGVRVPADVVMSIESQVAEATGSRNVPAIDVDGVALGRASMDSLDALLNHIGQAQYSQVRLEVPVRAA